MRPMRAVITAQKTIERRGIAVRLLTYLGSISPRALQGSYFAQRVTYVSQVIRKRKPSITSKCPGLAGRRSQKAKGRADDKGDKDRGHDRRSSVRVCSVVENFDEVITGAACQGGFQVTDAEAKSKDDGKTEGSIEENGADHTPRDDRRRILNLFSCGFVNFALIAPQGCGLPITYPYDTGHHNLIICQQATSGLLRLPTTYR